MRSLVKTCGMAALVVTAACLSLSEVQAGGRRCAHRSQQYYAAPATAGVITMDPATANSTSDGRQRYQSAYQAPAAMPNTTVYAAPTYYSSSPARAVRFQDRTFQEQTSADRKIRGL